jgi:DNA replication and repair protein RecF
MYLTHLSLTDYRAFARLDMDLPRRILLLVGQNAQGKTSLLEAIYYLATYTSFQASHDRQLINFLAGNQQLAVGRLKAEFKRGEKAHRMEVRLIQDSSNGTVRLRKEILIDGAKRTFHDALGLFNAVMFLPQMTRILEGGPEERRRYLNLAIAQAMPGYARDLSEYSQILTQRNALLKQLGERSGDPSQLDYWDEMLVKRGAAIVYARIHAIAELEQLLMRTHMRLTNGQEVLRLNYQPAYEPLPQPQGQFALPMQTSIDRTGLELNQIQHGFLQKLKSLHREEIARGVTTIGPHRDDLRFLSNSIDLGDFGSRGQVRTTLLGLKLAEVGWLKEKTGHWPVLLLDEVLAELDSQRRADLLQELSGCEQVLVTTTDLNMFSDDFLSQNTIWHVKAGQVTATPEDL